MHKLFFLLFFLFASTLAAAPLELVADKILQEDTVTKAEGDVVLLRGLFYARADRIRYDHASGIAELYGNVYLSHGENAYMLTDYAFLSLTDESLFTDNLFFEEPRANLWITATQTRFQQGEYRLEEAVTSSCDPNNPDWSIRFSSGSYDSETKWINLYNPRFYAGRVPVFYLPYFGYPTDRTRRSGLLQPRFGTSDVEGFVYEQPFYLTTGPTWDLELLPQYRERRGQGALGRFRFVDSPRSYGILEAGFFKNNDDFVKENDYQRNEHAGYRIYYQREGVFKKPEEGEKDALRLDFTHISDVDYLDVKSVARNENEETISKLVTNTFTYFYGTNDAYSALTGKHFIDTTTTDNDMTVHILPQLQYHHYPTRFLDDALLLKADYLFRNFTQGYTAAARENTLQVPLTWHKRLADDLLHLSATENLYLYDIRYTDRPGGLEDGSIVKNFLQLGLGTELAKPYETFFHTMSLQSTYTKPAIDQRNGDFNETFSVVEAEKENVDFSFYQYFFGKDGEPFLTHRLSQTYLMEATPGGQPDLENELIFRFGQGYRLRNLLTYSHNLGAPASSTTTLTYKGEILDAAVTDIYQEEENDQPQKRYNIGEATYRFHPLREVAAQVTYDRLEGSTRGWGVSWRSRKQCWDYTLTFRRKLVPFIAATGQTDSRINDIIYLRINILPFGGFEQQLYHAES